MEFKCFKKIGEKSFYIGRGKLDDNLNIIEEEQFCIDKDKCNNACTNFISENAKTKFEYSGNRVRRIINNNDPFSKKRFIGGLLVDDDSRWIETFDYKNCSIICNSSIMMWNNIPIANYINTDCMYLYSLRPQATPKFTIDVYFDIKEIRSGVYLITWPAIYNANFTLSEYDLLMKKCKGYVVIDSNIGRILEESSSCHDKYIYSYSADGKLMSAKYIIYDIPNYNKYDRNHDDDGYTIFWRINECIKGGCTRNDLYTKSISFSYNNLNLLKSVDISEKYFFDNEKKEFDAKDIGLVNVYNDKLNYVHNNFNENIDDAISDKIYYEYI